MITSSIANGIGNPTPALVFTISRLLVIYLPLVWLLSKYMGLEGIYLATAISNVMVGIGAWYWTQRKCQGEATVQTA